ncbi:TRAP transporter large permease [Shumkonia mesophila]|uniref:TRAP transporter large permease n=1 Tax=Shumkonia mesophila TaxID=2838854 RepID=UPI002934A2A6|nr:TRAP transporter large permease subunit [Shumkonia mesophila]
MTTALILLALVALLLVGIPVAFALGGLALGLMWVADLAPVIVPQALYGSIDNFVLLSVPLFLLMSNVLLKGGIGRDLFGAVQSWVGHWPGGLAIATVITCALFSAIAGSSIATAATIATVAIPEMIGRGYNRPFVLGLLAAGGTLGILIPPSIPMIVFGVITDQSIIDLFLAGIGPGLLLAGMFALYSLAYARFGGNFAPLPKASWDERARATTRALPTVVLAFIVIGGIYAGVFTPTEAAAIGFAVALIIVFALRTMTWEKLKQAVMESMRTTVTIFLIMAGAAIFGKVITLYRIPQDISAAIGANIGEPGLFILIVCVVLLVVGFFLESMSMLLIMVPVLYPSLMALGIDPIWFGIIFVVMIECALITPPVGLNLFVIQAVADAPITEVLRGVWPFILIMFTAVVAIYFVPDIALYIPFKL